MNKGKIYFQLNAFILFIINYFYIYPLHAHHVVGVHHHVVGAHHHDVLVGPVDEHVGIQVGEVVAPHHHVGHIHVLDVVGHVHVLPEDLHVMEFHVSGEEMSHLDFPVEGEAKRHGVNTHGPVTNAAVLHHGHVNGREHQTSAYRRHDNV